MKPKNNIRFNINKTTSIVGCLPQISPTCSFKMQDECFTNVCQHFVALLLKKTDNFLVGIEEETDFYILKFLLDAKQCFNQLRVIAVIPSFQMFITWDKLLKKLCYDLFEQCDDVYVTGSGETSKGINIMDEWLINHSCACISLYNVQLEKGVKVINYAKEKERMVRQVSYSHFSKG